MPGIIEGIAFMPPDRTECTEAARLRLGIRKLNLETRRQREANASPSTLRGCFGCRSSSSDEPRSNNRNGTGSSPPPQPSGGAYTTTASASSNTVDGPDFDPTHPFTTFAVAVPDTSKFGQNVCPTALLRSWTGLVILFAHGNAEDLSGVSYYWSLAKRLGVAVVAYDYLGYGWSSGDKKDCTEANAFRVVRRMFDFVVEDCGKDRSKLFVMGRSLGSGSATHIAFEECKRHVAKIKNAHRGGESVVDNQTVVVATTVTTAAANTTVANDSSAATATTTANQKQNGNKGILATLHNGPFAGLILYSPLYSAVAATGKLWASGIFGDIMCNYSKVGDIIKHVPILIVHGTDDEVIPFKCAKELYVKCGGSFGASTPPPPSSSSAASSPTTNNTRDAGNKDHATTNLETSPPPSPAPPAHPTSGVSFSGGQEEVLPTPSQCAAYLKSLPPRRAYFRPMPRCGHNDIEARVPQVFYSCVTAFLRAECPALGGGRGKALGGNASTGVGGTGGPRAAAVARTAGSAQAAGPIEAGGYQFQALGKASKPIVSEDDPVWGKPKI